MSTVHILRRAVLATTVAIGIALVTVISGLAKGNFDRITIVDAKSGREIVVNMPGLMGFFAFSDFENGTREAPVVAGPGYEITRWSRSGDGAQAYVAFDRLRWYDSSSTNTRAHGWILYEGIVNGSSEFDGLWFTSTRNADGLMEDILSGGQATTVGNGATRPGHLTPLSYGLAGIGAALLIASIATVGFLRKRKSDGADRQVE